MVAARNEKEAEIKLKDINANGVISHQESDVLDTWFSSAALFKARLRRLTPVYPMKW